ncbi:MAG: sensor histidine kinase [Pseudonocardia sp.]
MRTGYAGTGPAEARVVAALTTTLVRRFTDGRPAILIGTALTLHIAVILPVAPFSAASEHAAETIRFGVDAIMAGLLLLAIGWARARRRTAAPAGPDELADRRTERDHELRSGLAGLGGVTKLLEMSPADEERALLHASVTAELSRLRAMLDDVGADAVQRADPAVAAAYAVAPVLQSQIALRRSIGMDIRLAADPDLWAAGSHDPLTQVISNLLANCARHAPGSPVRVRATRLHDRIEIRIFDHGPGIAPGWEDLVFERGACGPTTGGTGLGLHISRRLLEANGGSLTLASSAPGRGTTMVVDLPGHDQVDTTADPVDILMAGAR